MGSSMSDPATFKQKNREKHLQAYQKKYPENEDIPPKIRLKQVRSEMTFLKKQPKEFLNSIQHEEKHFQSDTKYDHNPNKQLSNQNEEKQNQNNFKTQPQSCEIKTQIIPQCELKQVKNKNVQLNTVNNSNSGSSKTSGIKKITLNKQTYEIDIQKMKSRRLKNKERYTNSMLSSVKTQTLTQTRNLNPKLLKTNYSGQAFSSLGLQSQLNSLKVKQSPYDSHQKQSDYYFEEDKLRKRSSSNLSAQKSKPNKSFETVYKKTNNQLTKQYHTERKQ